ncbi:MAG: phosphate acyltransferase PlsX [Acidobacteriota bacterium]|jgi:glycerol-3-phosphate acyltransferase PlsX|nr:phosphate acyltransferase PlsX [Acidobacteriota bacterium]
MIKIAVDSMGSDNSPFSEVEGVVQAAKAFDVNVILVGKESMLAPLLKEAGGTGLPIEIRNATQVIAMDESPTAALRKKRDSSIRVAADLVREKVASGLVSAGNTGAVMAISKMVFGSVPGVDRPALATVLPTLAGHAVLLDVGANVACKPHHLVQFAVMGHLFSKKIVGVPNPRVGLMSVGEEESKGNELTKEVHKVLKQLHLNFIGNVEGRDIYNGRADVIVCDGFTGNVALKTSEGLIEAVLKLLKEELSRNLQVKVGALLSKQSFKRLKKRLDYSEYGGAPLLGLRGVSIICHGRSSSNAIKNAIRVAKEFAENQVNAKLEAELSQVESITQGTVTIGGQER